MPVNLDVVLMPDAIAGTNLRSCAHNRLLGFAIEQSTACSQNVVVHHLRDRLYLAVTSDRRFETYDIAEKARMIQSY